MAFLDKKVKLKQTKITKVFIGTTHGSRLNWSLADVPPRMFVYRSPRCITELDALNIHIQCTCTSTSKRRRGRSRDLATRVTVNVRCVPVLVYVHGGKVNFDYTTRIKYYTAHTSRGAFHRMIHGYTCQ